MSLRTQTPSVLCRSACLLGEGALWHGATLYWVDIKQCRIHAWRAGKICTWTSPDFVCWLVPCKGYPQNEFIVGLRREIAHIRLAWRDNAEGTMHIVQQKSILPADSPLRLNDGKADRWGRIWLGTMSNEEGAEAEGKGALWRLNRDWSLTQLDVGLTIPNGPAFSADGFTAYHADSARQIVFAYHLSPNGEVLRKTEWLRFRTDDGYPDGMTVDQGGGVWIAHWGAACVTRHDARRATYPDAAGQETHRLRVVAYQPTSVAWGGVDQRTLFITSARIGLSTTTTPPLQENDGAVFVATFTELGLAGLPPACFG